MRLQESGEMYLETILVLSKKQQRVRSIDVAEEMGFSRPSVSRAVSRLKQDGYISVDRDGFLILEEPGLEVARTIYERHCILSDVLELLGVDEKTAIEDACRMEHYISDTSFQAIKAYLEKAKEEAK